MTPRKTPVTFRAYSPSPIRKRGSLLDLFSTNNNIADSNMALTYGGNMIDNNNVQQKPRKLTSKEIDETYKGEIPETSNADLPPSFNEVSERQRIAELLVIEKLDFQLNTHTQYSSFLAIL